MNYRLTTIGGLDYDWRFTASGQPNTCDLGEHADFVFTLGVAARAGNHLRGDLQHDIQYNLTLRGSYNCVYHDGSGERVHAKRSDG